MKRPTSSNTLAFRLTVAAVFAALTCVATIALTLGIPATGGYFNVGEIVIYVGALIFGPIVGAFGGGIGASLADLALGAGVFAPGTLVIKGLEGAIVGFLNRGYRTTSRTSWAKLTAILGIGIGLFLAATGYLFVSQAQMFSADQNKLQLAIFWSVTGVIIAVVIIFTGFKVQPQTGRAVFSVIIGGLEMVIGYFLYEQLILSEAGAIVEIPVNIGQMMVGLIVAIPVVQIVLRSLPQLKN